MKKLLTIMICALMVLSMVGCTKQPDPTPTPGPDPTTVDTATFEELLAAGKANGNKLTIYTTHSVIEDAVKAFALKYGIDPTLVEATQIGDTNQVTQVATEVSSGVAGADLIFIQDGGRVLSELVKPGYVYNWYNEEIKALVGEDCEPLLVWDYCNKVFIYNSATVEEGEITNIWYVTDPQYKGTVKMKDPSSEGVNMNFLIMLTSDEYAAKLTDAYKEYYGTDLVLDADCPNAGYQLIKMMYNNELILGSSDGTIAKEIGDPAVTDKKLSGYLTLNKYVKTAKSSVEIDGVKKNYNLNFAKEVNPVAGFIYPIYGLLVKNADNAELAKAFLIWLYSEEGWVGNGELTTDGTTVYKGMTGRFGDYSGNQALAVTEGDLPLVEWKKVLISEDAQYCADYRADVEDFITLLK